MVKISLFVIYALIAMEIGKLLRREIKHVGKGRHIYKCPRCLKRFSHARDLVIHGEDHEIA
jgi:hypothetical protein